MLTLLPEEAAEALSTIPASSLGQKRAVSVLAAETQSGRLEALSKFRPLDDGQEELFFDFAAGQRVIQNRRF